MPEEKIPTIDESLIPAYSKQKELIEKVSYDFYAEHGNKSPSFTNTSIYRSRNTGSPRPKVS